MSINSNGTLERTGDWIGVSGSKATVDGAATRTADIWNPEYTPDWASGESTAETIFTPATSETGYIHVALKYYDGATTTYRFQVFTYNKTGASTITIAEVEDFGSSTRDCTLANASGALTVVYSGAALTSGQTVQMAIRSERGYTI